MLESDRKNKGGVLESEHAGESVIEKASIISRGKWVPSIQEWLSMRRA